MTVAACYVSPEGVVLGADSATTYASAAGVAYLNHAQKVFEVGENSSLGAATWGLGIVGSMSLRAIVAKLGDDCERLKLTSVEQAANRLQDIVLEAFRQSAEGELIAEWEQLQGKLPWQDAIAAGTRSESEEARFQLLKDELRPNFIGFYLGGYMPTTREAQAWRVTVDFDVGIRPPAKLSFGSEFAGAANAIDAVTHGLDRRLRNAMIQEGWSKPDSLGSMRPVRNEDFDALIRHLSFHAPPKDKWPMRDAVDHVHSTIQSVIKSMKFTDYSRSVGGPIEVAAITVDRRFRWVKHKRWDSAIVDGVTDE